MKRNNYRIMRLIAGTMVVFLLLLSPASTFADGVSNEKLTVISEELRKDMEATELAPTDKLDVLIWMENEITDELLVKKTEEATGLSLEDITRVIPLISEEDYAIIKDLEDDDFREEMEKRIDKEALEENERNSLLMN